MAHQDQAEPDNILGLRFGSVTQDEREEGISGKKLINIKLLENNTASRASIRPRSYQAELHQQALDENVVIYLGTGLGKTFIVILFINSPYIDSQIQLGRKIAFLAPTQDLVIQQAEYIYTKVPYKVRVYCGRSCVTGIHVDKWKDEEWERQLSEIDVLVMTPQIFQNAIVQSYIKWTNLSAVIFDEAHHSFSAKKVDSGHPYSKILENYDYFVTQCPSVQMPRLIGLTASLINNMPKDLRTISQSISKLEHRFRGKCITSTDGIDSKPLMVVHTHSRVGVTPENDVICDLFNSYADLMKNALGLTDKRKVMMLNLGLAPKCDSDRDFLAFHERLNLASSGISLKPSSFHKVLKQLVRVRESSGLWTLANILHLLVDAMEKHSKNRCISIHVRPLYIKFGSILQEVLSSIALFLGQNWNDILLEYSQPKMRALLDILKNEHDRVQAGESDKFSCIVFVQSRVEVLSLHNWLNQVSKYVEEYNFLRVGYAIGMAATLGSKWACITRRKPIEQQGMLNNFRMNLLNVVVTTSVLEEGIDLPVCSTVIRFNQAKTFRVYIQSRGRARQQKSSYITLTDPESTTQVNNDLTDFNKFDTHIKNALQDKDISRFVPRSYGRQNDNDDDSLYTDEALELEQVRIDSITAGVIINRYSNHLSRSYPFSNGIVYRRIELKPDLEYQTGLTLPFGCPIKHEVLGNVKSTLDLANKSAMIALLKELHKIGELDEKGRPILPSDERTDQTLSKYDLMPDMTPFFDPDETIITSQDDRQVYQYPWRAFKLEILERMRFSLDKTYKLIKFVFEPANDRVRKETESLFRQSSLGMIIDSSRNCDLLPKRIFSHYGEFNVRYEVLRDDMTINDHSLHNDYFNYTYKLIRFCWSIGFIERHEFMTRCLFYFVPIDNSSNIDARRLIKSFQIKPNCALKAFDIVKLGKYFQRDRMDSQKLFMVKRVHLNMNANSLIPGRRRETFYQHAQEVYGIEIRHLNQPIIEVVQISRKVATYSVGKKADAEHASSSLFYLEQFLDLFDSDAACVFQSFNLPSIIYRLYLGFMCADLDRKFVSGTIDKRTDKIVLLEASSTSQTGAPIEYSNDEADEEQQIMELEQGEDQENQYEPLEDDENDYNSDSDDYDSSDYEPRDSSDEEEEVTQSNTDENNNEKWQRYEDSLPESSNWSIVNESSEHKYSQKYVNTNPRFYESFGLLKSKTEVSLQFILEGLAKFKQGILGDLQIQDDEAIFNREGPVVDKTIKPPFKFDELNSTFNSKKSREFGILEALTQRRATEEFNLEALENIGDAYLKYCTSVVLYKTLKDSDEGILTSARSRLIGNKHFAHLARRNYFGSFAIANKFQEKSVISMLGAPEAFKNKLKAKDLADTFESLIGAYLVSCGEFEAIIAIDYFGLKLVSKKMFAELHENSVRFSREPSALSHCDSFESDPKVQQVYQMSRTRLQRFQKIISYQFQDPSYLMQALTHASHPMAITKSYERLEFLGDAILDYLTTLTLFNAGFTKCPGQLTTSRSMLVNNCTFARLAIKYRYDIFLQHANRDLFDILNAVSQQSIDDSEMEFIEELQYDQITKLLGDIFEAVAGAIYLDSGCSLDAVWSVYYPMMKENFDKEIANPSKNVVMQVYEKYPERVEFEFDHVNEEGTLDIYIRANCKIRGAGIYMGLGMTRQLAKMRAARKALEEAPELPRLERKRPARSGQAGQSRGRGRGRGHSRGRPRFDRRPHDFRGRDERRFQSRQV